MKTLLTTLTLLLIVPAVALAQDWREELGSDMVTISDGKMVYQEFGLVKITFPGYETNQFQVKLYSEAPHESVMTRDKFVALTSSYFTILLLESIAQAYQVTAAEFLEAFDYTELDNPIGTPDLEMNLFMTDEGMQFEIVNTQSGERVRHTMTWEEVFGG